MPGLRFYVGLFVGPRLRRGGAVRRPSVLGHRPKTLMSGAIHLSPADQIKGSPAGPTVPLVHLPPLTRTGGIRYNDHNAWKPTGAELTQENKSR